MGELVHAFFEDTRVQIALLVVILDFLLGVIAALRTRTFRLSYVADFLRNDIVFKVGGFFALYAGYVYASGADIVIPGLDLEMLMNGAWVVVLGALTGSALNSLRDIGLWSGAPDAIAGPDPESPTVSPASPQE